MTKAVGNKATTTGFDSTKMIKNKANVEAGLGKGKYYILKGSY